MVGARKWPFILRCLVASRSTSGTAIRTRPLGRLLCNRLPGSAYGRVAQTKTPMAYCASSSLKGADLSDLSQTNLNAVAGLTNDRPGKTLGWNTPAAAMAEERAAIKSTRTLQTWIQAVIVYHHLLVAEFFIYHIRKHHLEPSWKPLPEKVIQPKCQGAT